MAYFKKNWQPILVLIIILLVWELYVRFFNIPLYVLPSFSKVLICLFENWDVLLKHAFTTLIEALIGLVIAMSLSFVTAILMDNSNIIKKSIYPHLVITQTVPVMVLAPLFSIWFGFGITPKIMIVIFMCYFPITISFCDGLAQVDKKMLALLKTMRASKFQIYYLVKIPSAMQNYFSGLKVAATYCVGGAIVGEWISSANGLGYYMLRAKNGYMLDKVFASVIVVIVLSLLLNLIVHFLEKRICYQYRLGGKK